MEVKTGFKIKYEYVDERLKEGFLFLEVNGKSFGENRISYSINEALNSIIGVLNSKEKSKENYSNLLYSLEKKKLMNLWEMVRNKDPIDKTQFNKKEFDEMAKKVDSIVLYTNYYQFDSICVMLICSDLGERLIVHDDIDCEEFYFKQNDSFMAKLLDFKMKIGLPQFFHEPLVLSKEEFGCKTFRCNGFATSIVFETAVMDAQKRIFYQILFKGISGEEGVDAILKNEVETLKIHKDYFDNLFEVNFINFIKSSEIRSFLIEVVGGYQVTIDVKIDMKKLRNDLGENRI